MYQCNSCGTFKGASNADMYKFTALLHITTGVGRSIRISILSIPTLVLVSDRYWRAGVDISLLYVQYAALLSSKSSANSAPFTSCMHTLLLLPCSAVSLSCRRDSAALRVDTCRLQSLAERKRSVVWRCSMAVNKNLANCDVCKKAFLCCGNTTNFYKHMKKHEKENPELQKTWREEEGNPSDRPSNSHRVRGHW